jgi:hypothetical protein
MTNVYVLRNNFHETEVRVRIGHITNVTAKRIASKLCPSITCTCRRTQLGTRGPQDLDIVEDARGFTITPKSAPQVAFIDFCRTLQAEAWDLPPEKLETCARFLIWAAKGITWDAPLDKSLQLEFAVEAIAKVYDLKILIERSCDETSVKLMIPDSKSEGKKYYELARANEESC